jgi:hypothetical protein
MATTVRSLLNRAAALLSDKEFVRWEESELLEWLNDGQNAIARGPATDVYVLRDNISTQQGSVQNMPDDNIRLIEIVKDVATGHAILQADYAIVDVLAPTWREDNTGTAKNYFYDERNPDQFELYPPQEVDTLIEIVYNAQPPDATITGSITINDDYADCLIDYMVYRALSKDTEDTATETRKADRYFQAFLIGAGFKDAADAMIEPGRS